jgi:hypothetical protein
MIVKVKGKGKLYPITSLVALRGSKGIALLIFNLGARRGGWSVLPPGRFTPGKDSVPIVHKAGWDPGRSGRVRKISPPPEFNPRTIQPVVSRYTD